VYLQVDADISEKHAVSIFRGSSDEAGKCRSYIEPEEQGLRAGSQSEEGNMGTGRGPIGSLQEGYREGVGCGVRKEREREPSSAPEDGNSVSPKSLPVYTAQNPRSLQHDTLFCFRFVLFKYDLQGDPVDCNPPIWLQFCSMAVDPPLTF
jgi:hypothetical protein